MTFSNGQFIGDGCYLNLDFSQEFGSDSNEDYAGYVHGYVIVNKTYQIGNYRVYDVDVVPRYNDWSMDEFTELMWAEITKF